MPRRTLGTAIPLLGACVLLAGWEGCGQPVRGGVEGPDDLVEVEVKTIQADPNQAPVVLLGPSDGSVVLPIWVGSNEAQAIALELSRAKLPRPLTHNLVGSVIQGLRAHMEKVIVTHIEDNTYYARIVLSRGETVTEIDSRPSDAIAVALQLGAPIFVRRSVLDAAAYKRPPTPESWNRYGFRVQPLSRELAPLFGLEPPQGVLVRQLLPGGAAEKSGLRVGDVVTRVGSETVGDPDSLSRALEGSSSPVVLTLLRGGKTLSIQVPSETSGSD